VGRAFGETVCAGQAMFQKNTGLAIWISHTHLSPVASIGDGCYVLWQNFINAVQLWKHGKNSEK
ncbi:MAG: transporter, partial [Kiritimatiellae bacterium]|nr:transporter [Kiritimatiellia bacterium]